MHDAENQAEGRILDTFLTTVGLEALRGAVVAAACVAMPAACPAIMALNEAYKAGRAGQQIYRAYARAEGSAKRRAVFATAAEVAAARAITAAVGGASDPVLKQVSESFGNAVATQQWIGPTLDPTYAKLLAQQAAYYAIKEGLGGVISWGVKHVAG